MSEKSLQYIIAAAVNGLLGETKTLDDFNKKSVKSLRSMMRDIKAMQAATANLVTEDIATTSTSAKTGSSTLKWLKSTGKSSAKSYFFKSDSSESDSDESKEWTARKSLQFSAIKLRPRTNATYKQSIEQLVYCLRGWRMELEDIKYKDTDFDAPLTVWTRKERNLMKAEMRAISYEKRKKMIADKLVEVNKYQKASKGIPAKLNLATQMADLLVQDIFLLRVMPFREVVFPSSMEDVYCWDRVSNAVKGRHTPAECREFWFTKFDPHINGKCWSKAENKVLISLADAFNLQHWEQISALMNTDRTAFQCYVQFRRYLYKPKPVVDNPPRKKGGGKNKSLGKNKGIAKRTKATNVDAASAKNATISTDTTTATDHKIATEATSVTTNVNQD